MNTSVAFHHTLCSSLCVHHICAILMRSVTNFMQLSSSWGASSRSATQEFAFYGTRRFITAFIRALHCSLSWARSIQSIPPHPISLKRPSNARILPVFGVFVRHHYYYGAWGTPRVMSKRPAIATTTNYLSTLVNGWVIPFPFLTLLMFYC
jgi:hypothetical protein